jgi:hypothetical protein
MERSSHPSTTCLGITSRGGRPRNVAPVGEDAKDADGGRRTTGAACPARRSTGARRHRPGSHAAVRGSRGGPPSRTRPPPRGRRRLCSAPLAITPKTTETWEQPRLPGAGSPACRPLRRPPPPPALRALVARAARRQPSRGRVAVDDVRGDQVRRGDSDSAAPVRAGRRGQGQQQRPCTLVLHAVPARLAGGTPALARRASRPGHDAGGRVPVVAGADHAAPARLVTTPQTVQSSTRESSTGWLTRSIRLRCYACGANVARPPPGVRSSRAPTRSRRRAIARPPGGSGPAPSTRVPDR